MSNSELKITRPDDWHLHLRDGGVLRAVLPFSSRVFARALIMPNLNPPVIGIQDALAYRQRIMQALPAGSVFNPLMTCYLTDDTDAQELIRGHKEGVFLAAKLYPAGATTNSAMGVTAIKKIYPVLEAMQADNMPLSVHGEVTDHRVDIFDREAVFIEQVLDPLRRDFPGLRIVLEHLTSQVAVAYVSASGQNLGATITPHHLIINRSHLFSGGMRPHMYCLPVAKREADRRALVQAATSGDSSFFLGTDSAPHPVSKKETAGGCAGIFCAPYAVERICQVFDEAGALHNLEKFVSLNGPAFYRLSPNEQRITLRRRPAWLQAEDSVKFEGGSIRMFCPSQPLNWEICGTGSTGKDALSRIGELSPACGTR